MCQYCGDYCQLVPPSGDVTTLFIMYYVLRTSLYVMTKQNVKKITGLTPTCLTAY
jgi:hypothetical protein